MRKNVLIVALVLLVALVGCADHEHAWSEWKKVKEPTCTEAGSKTRTCIGCNEVETEEIPALGHKWNDGETTTEATCKKEGVKTFTCENCKETRTEAVPVDYDNGHKFGTDGICSVCNQSQTMIENAVARVGSTYYETLDGLFEKEKGESIEVVLLKDAELSIGANKEKPIGGDSTKSIAIDGNNKTLSFKGCNSDWTYVLLNNDETVLSIKDATIKKTGYGADGGPWNNHDICFNCKVLLENVESKTAIALYKDASFRNVSISDKNAGQDTYMLWIVANGQTVELDGCVIDGKSSVEKSNRAVAIKDQYVTDPESVSLLIRDTNISADKKAAILVSSKGGANIELVNVDIEGTPDKVNAVWIDNGADYGANIKDKVIVKGGSVIIEGN